MKHLQVVIWLFVAIGVAFALFTWAGSLWAGLGALVGGLSLVFVMSMAWLWSPRSGIGRGRQPTEDPLDGLPKP